MARRGTSRELVIHVALEDSEPSELLHRGLLTYQLRTDEFSYSCGWEMFCDEGLVVDDALHELLSTIVQRELQNSVHTELQLRSLYAHP